jgi:hypothetical protein
MGSLISSASGTKSQQKSVCQIRGVPHPLACAFIGDAPHLIAVAGWDHDGNGVLLISEFAAHQEARRVAYHVLVKNSSTADETEEERRRRRARGWVPGGGGTPANTSEDDPSMHFGHLRISDEMAEEAHRFQTQTTDDDFCEVIVEPRNNQNRKEPVIEDKPLSSSQEQQQQQQSPSQSLAQNNEIEEIDFSAANDNSTDIQKLVTANDSTADDDNKDNDINNDSNSNSNEEITTTTTKDIEIDASSEKDYTATQDSVPIEPLEEDDGGAGNDDDDDDDDDQEE